jgi:hypothetical protein
MSTVEKMKTYSEDVKQIAILIRNGFYAEEFAEEEFEVVLDNNVWFQDEKLMDRAVKVHQYFPCVEEAKKVLKFLQMANPVCGKMFVEHL